MVTGISSNAVSGLRVLWDFFTIAIFGLRVLGMSSNAALISGDFGKFCYGCFNSEMSSVHKNVDRYTYLHLIRDQFHERMDNVDLETH